jgi:photosystem II stability/assembly factor-like uncharacterized protein
MITRKSISVFILSFIFLGGIRVLLAQAPFWQQTNGPEGGDITGLVMNSEGDLFAATYRGGIFLSTNAGTSWTPINNGIGLTTWLSMLAYSPNSDSVFVSNGCNIWRTSDKGENWVLTNFDPSAFGGGVTSIAVSKDGWVFAGTFEHEVVRSKDDGQSWQIVGAGQVHPYVTSLAFNGDGDIFAGTQAGVYTSSDDGDNWSIVPGSEDFNVTALGVDPSDNHVHVGTAYDPSSPNQVSTYCYTDGAWIGTQRTFLQVEVFGFHGGTVYAGTWQNSGVHRSQDHGLTWESIGLGYYDPKGLHSVRAMAVDPTGVIFAGTTYDGVFKWAQSENGWTRLVNGMRAADVRSITVAQDGGVLAGTLGAGIFRSADKGEIWTQVNSALVNQAVGIYSMVMNSNGHIFAAGGGISVSVDGGITWQSLDVQTLPGYNATALAINRANVIYAGSTNGIYRSRDNGVDWEFLSGLENKDIRSLAIDSAGRIFAGGINYTGLWRSDDEGDTWIPITGFEDAYYIQSIAINPKDDVFVSGHVNGVMRSSDGGDTWVRVYPNQASVIAINSEGRIFAGFDGSGVISSTDNGNTWQEVNDGLMNPSIFALAFDADGYLYSGHWGGGVSRSIETTLTRKLLSLSPAKLWIGLKNSDDVGTTFDLLAEVYRNGAIVGSGQLNNIAGGSSGFNNAKLNTVPLTLFASVSLNPEDTLAVKLSVRIAAESRHKSGTARLWFNDPVADSHFGATVSATTDSYYMVVNSRLSLIPGLGPKLTSDVLVDRSKNGNPFKVFGTWIHIQ